MGRTYTTIAPVSVDTEHGNVASVRFVAMHTLFADYDSNWI